MSIIDNLKKAQKAIDNDTVNGTGLELGEQVREAAVEAITNGRDSDEWKKYMALFCDNANELAQLTVVRQTDESWMPLLRTYTPAGALCFPDTNTDLGKGIEAINLNIEPPANAVVPQGTKEPDAIRDNNLADKLR